MVLVLDTVPTLGEKGKSQRYRGRETELVLLKDAFWSIPQVNDYLVWIVLFGGRGCREGADR